MSQEQALSQFCEPPQTGGQKAALGSRKLVFVSSIISASYTTHIGAPPYPLQAIPLAALGLYGASKTQWLRSNISQPSMAKQAWRARATGTAQAQ
jgi:hypothetical protein